MFSLKKPAHGFSTSTSRRSGTRRRLVIGVLTASLIVLSPCVASIPAHADSRSDLVEAKKRKQQEIEQVRQELAGVKDEISNAYVQILETESQIATAQIELQDAQDALGVARRESERVTSQLEAARGELDSIRQDINEGNEKIEATRDSLGALARAQYRGDTTPTTMELLVGSSSASDFLDSFATSHAITRTQTTALTEVEQITARNKTREARQVDVEQQINELKEQADALVAEREEKEREASAKKSSLDSLQASLNSQVHNFQAYSSQLESQISVKQAQSAQISAQIASIDAARQGGGQSSGGVATGRFIQRMVPSATIVTSHFGNRWHPVVGGWILHSGTDFAAACGTPQYAPANGTVTGVYYDVYGGGNTIVFNLGTINGHSWVVKTLHLQTGSIAVSVGQHVTQGQFVALTGTTGYSTGCHVHQEIWRDGVPIDPLTIL